MAITRNVSSFHSNWIDCTGGSHTVLYLLQCITGRKCMKWLLNFSVAGGMSLHLLAISIVTELIVEALLLLFFTFNATYQLKIK